MTHRYHRPHEATSAYVRTVLLLEGNGTPASNTLPLFTNGMPALICHTGQDNKGALSIRELSLYGKSIPPEALITDDNSSMIVYFFKPFTIASLFDVPANVLMQQKVDLDNWNPLKTNALKTQMVYAGTIEKRVEILDNLLKHLAHENYRECEIVQYATDYIMCNPGSEPLDVVLDHLSLTKRTFQRIFKKYVGITATQYRRICQFQLSFDQVKSKKFDKLADVAYDNGFADQSHFIRAFKEFASTTPNDYLRKGLNGEK